MGGLKTWEHIGITCNLIQSSSQYITRSTQSLVHVQFLSTFSKKGAASKQLKYPCGICVGSDQLVYVCDYNNKCVSVFKTSGEVTSFGQFSCPAGIAIDDDGFVYVSNYVAAGKVYIL